MREAVPWPRIRTGSRGPGQQQRYPWSPLVLVLSGWVFFNHVMNDDPFHAYHYRKLVLPLRYPRHYWKRVSKPICGTESIPYTKFRPARPRMIRLTSRVVQPPASGVPAIHKYPKVRTCMDDRKLSPYLQEQDQGLQRMGSGVRLSIGLKAS